MDRCWRDEGKKVLQGGVPRRCVINAAARPEGDLESDQRFRRALPCHLVCPESQGGSACPGAREGGGKPNSAHSSSCQTGCSRGVHFSSWPFLGGSSSWWPGWDRHQASRRLLCLGTSHNGRLCSIKSYFRDATSPPPSSPKWKIYANESK